MSKIDEYLANILDEMLSSASKITARSVSRRLSVAPSTLTRNNERMQLLQQYQQEQRRLQAIVARSDPLSKENLVKKIADRDRKISELNRLVQILTASHKAMLLAVGEIGGTAAWQRFFATYERIRVDLRKLDVVPDLTSDQS
jgi:hypothetical protein